jgi:hypothetical protein
MKATMTKVKWDKDDIRTFEHALKLMLSSIEAVALDKEDYESAVNQAIDHVIDQLDLHRE